GEPPPPARRRYRVSLALAWKILAGVVLLAVVATVGAITYFERTRPAALGLATVTPRAAASPSPDDPLSLVCRRPAVSGTRSGAGVAGLWVIQPYPVTLQLSTTSSAVQHAKLAGDLEIHGTTRPAQFGLDVRLSGAQLSAAGSTVVPVEEFGVEVPQEADGFVRVDPRITLEVSLVLLKL